MDLKITFLLVSCAALATSLPTMYKVNENKLLEKGVWLIIESKI